MKKSPAVIFLFLVVVFATAYWTKSNVEFYVQFFSHTAYHFSVWKALLLNILLTFCGGSSIWLNLLLSIVRIIL